MEIAQDSTIVGQRGEEIVLAEQSATLATLGDFGGIVRPETNHPLLIVNMPRARIRSLVLYSHRRHLAAHCASIAPRSAC